MQRQPVAFLLLAGALSANCAFAVGAFNADLDTATKLYKIKRYQQAANMFNKYLATNPNDAFAYSQLGMAYAKLHRYPDAIRAFQQAANIEPGSAIAHANMGQMYKLSGDGQNAAEEFAQAIKLTPNNLDYYYEHGNACVSSGDYVNALEDFNKIIATKPTAQAYFARGLILAKFSKNEAAIADLSKAIQLQPRFPAAYIQRSQLYSAIGQKALAQQDYQTAQQLQGQK